MSTIGKRNFRPKVHFSPEKNWNNDPNGLTYIDGVWHLYYQYYPEAPVWGPMHWGHAVSTDLLHWEHKPIALYPDELGFMFSGSMAYDKDNTSGFGTEGKIPMVAMYTSHGRDHVETQSIAYSLDGGLHFEKYYGNPVITNPGLQNFRDPKVFWNKKKECWSMVLAAHDRCFIYASKDLKEWEKTGEFGFEESKIKTVWECTDLLPIQTEEGEKWVVIVSMTGPGYDGKPCMQYFVGDFDGDTFVCTEHTKEPLLVDCGFDNYAGVTFANYDRPIFIGWGVCPQYAGTVPTGEFAGIMTIARELSLVKTEEGYRLKAIPFGIDHLKACARKAENKTALLTESFGLQVSGKQGTIVFSNLQGEKVVIEVTEDSLILDRSEAGAKDFSEEFQKDYFMKATAKRLSKEDVAMDILFDVSYMEVFADDGLEVMSAVMYPDAPYTTLEVTGDLKAELYPLK